jgi:hypothetical protein
MWSQFSKSVPASKVAGTDLADVVALDVDATIVIAHSEKANASPTYQNTFAGFTPIAVWCDNTTEFLARKPRTGRAGSDTATDDLEVLADAIRQVPGCSAGGC